ncbi:MAG: hypothetical protein V3V05_07715 [Pontiella sp.]
MANSYGECYIGKAKKECLNHINREWLSYYNNQRPHQGIDINNNVLDVDFRPTEQGEAKREQQLGGVIYWHYRAQACAA